MKAVGLIAEYNPFHNGHLYHIQTAKSITNADYVIVVMSGNFVQRGAPAIMDKYQRTKMCLQCGADLVLELPVTYATASAEQFAYGAISLFDSLHVVDSVCFGSESGNLDLLTQIAAFLVNESSVYKDFLQKELKKGLSFPVARSNALLSSLSLKPPFHTLDRDILKKEIQSPNNILGIEYIKAILKRKSDILPVTINRVGSHYNETILNHPLSSATAIRNALKDTSSVKVLKPYVPDSVYELITESYNRTFPIFEDDFSMLLRYKLLQENPNLTQYADVTTQLSKKISNAIASFQTFSQFGSLLKTKEQTHSGINRALTHIMLNMKKENAVSFEDSVPYARILGFRKNSTQVLNEIKKASALHLIAKLADAKSYLSGTALSMLEQDIFATDVYNTVVTDKFHIALPNEYTANIIKL